MVVDDRPRRVTSADVAREAGVSRTTVSYILNDTPHQKIPEATRQRVLQAVQRLEYAPSGAARALQRGRSDVVLCLLPDWPIGQALGAFLEHLSGALADAGLTLLAHPRPAGRPGATQVWRSSAPAAVITIAEADDDEVEAMRAAGIPVTVALLSAQGRRRGELAIGQERVGRMQAEHLAAVGHRRLGFAFPDDPRVLGFAEPRLAGVRASCADLGLDDPVVLTVPLDPAAAADAVTTWRSGDRPVTGVCSYNDDVALAVLAGMRLQGLRAPGGLAVVGVDDVTAAALADPPLTTVTVDQKVVAKHIAESITRALAGRPAPRRPGSDIVSLIQRASS